MEEMNDGCNIKYWPNKGSENFDDIDSASSEYLNLDTNSSNGCSLEDISSVCSLDDDKVPTWLRDQLDIKLCKAKTLLQDLSKSVLSICDDFSRKHIYRVQEDHNSPFCILDLPLYPPVNSPWNNSWKFICIQKCKMQNSPIVGHIHTAACLIYELEHYDPDIKRSSLKNLDCLCPFFIQNIIQEFKNFLSSYFLENKNEPNLDKIILMKPFWKSLTLRSNYNDEVLIIIVGSYIPLMLKEMKNYFENNHIAEKLKIVSIYFINQRCFTNVAPVPKILFGKSKLIDIVGNIKIEYDYKTSPSINRIQIELFAKTVLNLLELQGTEMSVLIVGRKLGIISNVLASNFQKLVVLLSSKEEIKESKEISNYNNIKNISFFECKSLVWNFFVDLELENLVKNKVSIVIVSQDSPYGQDEIFMKALRKISSVSKVLIIGTFEKKYHKPILALMCQDDKAGEPFLPVRSCLIEKSPILIDELEIVMTFQRKNLIDIESMPLSDLDENPIDMQLEKLGTRDKNVLNSQFLYEILIDGESSYNDLSKEKENLLSHELIKDLNSKTNTKDLSNEDTVKFCTNKEVNTNLQSIQPEKQFLEEERNSSEVEIIKEFKTSIKNDSIQICFEKLKNKKTAEKKLSGSSKDIVESTIVNKDLKLERKNDKNKEIYNGSKIKDIKEKKKDKKKDINESSKTAKTKLSRASKDIESTITKKDLSPARKNVKNKEIDNKTKTKVTKEKKYDKTEDTNKSSELSENFNEVPEWYQNQLKKKVNEAKIRLGDLSDYISSSCMTAAIYFNKINDDHQTSFCKLSEAIHQPLNKIWNNFWSFKCAQKCIFDNPPAGHTDSSNCLVYKFDKYDNDINGLETLYPKHIKTIVEAFENFINIPAFKNIVDNLNGESSWNSLTLRSNNQKQVLAVLHGKNIQSLFIDIKNYFEQNSVEKLKIVSIYFIDDTSKSLKSIAPEEPVLLFGKPDLKDRIRPLKILYDSKTPSWINALETKFLCKKILSLLKIKNKSSLIVFQNSLAVITNWFAKYFDKVIGITNSGEEVNQAKELSIYNNICNTVYFDRTSPLIIESNVKNLIKDHESFVLLSQNLVCGNVDYIMRALRKMLMIKKIIILGSFTKEFHASMLHLLIQDKELGDPFLPVESWVIDKSPILLDKFEIMILFERKKFSEMPNSKEIETIANSNSSQTSEIQDSESKKMNQDIKKICLNKPVTSNALDPLKNANDGHFNFNLYNRLKVLDASAINTKFINNNKEKIVDNVNKRKRKNKNKKKKQETKS